jgi:hypothetical protein
MIRGALQREFHDVPGLDYARDYLDARDVCRDLGALLQLDPSSSGIVSGIPTTIRHLLRLVASAIDANLQDLTDGLTSGIGRPDDVRWVVGDPSRFVRLTSASPGQIPIERSVVDAVAATGVTIQKE